MANIKKIEGYDLVQAELKNTSDENLYLVFYANVDGKKISWCPDCVKGTLYTFFPVLINYSVYQIDAGHFSLILMKGGYRHFKTVVLNFTSLKAYEYLKNM